MNNKFAVIPIEAFYDPLLTPAELKMLGILYSFRDKNFDTVWPGLDTIRDRAGYSDITQVSRMTTKLERKGWLDKSKKRGLRGTKIYKLNIPERLLPQPDGALPEDLKSQLDSYGQVDNSEQRQPAHSDSESQLDPNSQIDNLRYGGGEHSDPDCQLDSGSQLDPPGQGQLDSLGQRQLDHLRQPVREHTTEHTSDQTTETEPCGSAAGAAPAVDNSVLNEMGRFYDHPGQGLDQPEPNMITVGVEYMLRRGVDERRAWNVLRMFENEHGRSALTDALLECVIWRPAGDLVAYLRQILNKPRKPIPADWEPAQQTVGNVIGLGMNIQQLKLAHGYFLTWHSERGTTSNDWNEYFERWCAQDLERAEHDHQRHLTWLAQSAGLTYQPEGMTA